MSFLWMKNADFMDENCSGAGAAGGPGGGPGGAGTDRRNVGTCVGTCVGACVGPNRVGTSVGPAFRSYG